MNLIACSGLNYGGRVEFSENRFALSDKKIKKGDSITRNVSYDIFSEKIQSI